MGQPLQLVVAKFTDGDYLKRLEGPCIPKRLWVALGCTWVNTQKVPRLSTQYFVRWMTQKRLGMIRLANYLTSFSGGFSTQKVLGVLEIKDNPEALWKDYNRMVNHLKNGTHLPLPTLAPLGLTGCIQFGNPMLIENVLEARSFVSAFVGLPVMFLLFRGCLTLT